MVRAEGPRGIKLRNQTRDYRLDSVIHAFTRSDTDCLPCRVYHCDRWPGVGTPAVPDGELIIIDYGMLEAVSLDDFADFLSGGSGRTPYPVGLERQLHEQKQRLAGAAKETGQ